MFNKNLKKEIQEQDYRILVLEKRLEDYRRNYMDSELAMMDKINFLAQEISKLTKELNKQKKKSGRNE